MAYDVVTVDFVDTSSTMLYVDQDESIIDKIAELCDSSGWDSKDVIGFSITGEVEG